jgi:hypothetical protein
MPAGGAVGLGAIVADGTTVASVFGVDAVAWTADAGVVGEAAVVAVAVGFGVGVTRTWNPPQASVESNSTPNAKKTGQSVGRRFIFASRLGAGSWKLEARS